MIDATCLVERNNLSRSASGREYGHLILDLGTKLDVLPAQFAMIKPHALAEPLLRRAMAFHRCDNRGTSSRRVHISDRRNRHASTRETPPGDGVDFLGPLGNTFEEGTGEAILVAGGAGSPALFMFAEREKRARS